MKVLVTGGLGYIGSTIASALEDAGHIPIILASLVTGTSAFILGREFFQGDIANGVLLNYIFELHPDIVACIHCAALVVVPESVADPYQYYKENVAKSLELFRHLVALGCHRVVFSSSASVYAAVPDFMALESSPVAPSSPYARSKLMIEQMLDDICAATPLRALVLRYFNPIGSDPKLRSGVHVRFPSHVLGKLLGTALGIQSAFEITGTDFATRDGSGIRDYVHVWDLALAHVAAVERFDSVMKQADSNFTLVNLGTGSGVTVRELVAAFERVWGSPLCVVEAPRRAGDVAGAFAGSRRALSWLGWRAIRSLDDGIATALKWGQHRKDVLGYE